MALMGHHSLSPVTKQNTFIIKTRFHRQHFVKYMLYLIMTTHSRTSHPVVFDTRAEDVTEKPTPIVLYRVSTFRKCGPIPCQAV